MSIFIPCFFIYIIVGFIVLHVYCCITGAYEDEKKAPEKHPRKITLIVIGWPLVVIHGILYGILYGTWNMLIIVWHALVHNKWV